MAKKSQSQRRRKGNSSDFGEGNADALSESYTLADSLSVTTFDDLYSQEGDQLTDEDFRTNGNEPNDASRFSQLSETLATVDDIPTEKRSAKRESALRTLFKSISQLATGEAGSVAVYDRMDAIRTACLFSLRAGAPPEQYAACRVLEAMSVVLGCEQDEYCDSLSKPLRRIVMAAKSKAIAVRGAALRALVMANFICSSDDGETEDLLDFCQEVASQEYRGEVVPTTLRATALDCWNLLCTSLPNFRVSGQDDFRNGRGIDMLQYLKECLETTCPELRSASGECLAFIHETRLELGLSDQQSDNTTERKFQRGSWEGTKWEALMDEIRQQIADLAVESGHHMSKKAKKQQRATFREFVFTLVDDEPPEEVVAFRGGTLTLVTWREIVQLNFVRHCLQGGFQIQLLTNETLQSIFGANGELLNSLGNMSQIEKRLVMSKTSEAAKAADLTLTRNRRIKTNVKNHFLTIDGEDI